MARRRFCWIQGEAPLHLKLLVEKDGVFYVAGDRETPTEVATAPGVGTFEVTGLANTGPGLDDWGAGSYWERSDPDALTDVVFYGPAGVLETYSYEGFAFLNIGGNFAAIRRAGSPPQLNWLTPTAQGTFVDSSITETYILPGVIVNPEGVVLRLAARAAVDPTLSHAVARGGSGQSWRVYEADGTNYLLTLAVEVEEAQYLSLQWPRLYRVDPAIFDELPAAGVTSVQVDEYAISGGVATLQATRTARFVSPGSDYRLVDARYWVTTT